MKLRLQLALITGVCCSLGQLPAQGEDKPATTNLQERVSYALGVNIGSGLKRAGFEFNEKDLLKGIHDAMDGKSKMTDSEARQAVMAYQQQRLHDLAEKNTREGEAFLALNKTKDGVKVHTVSLADGKSAELQYKVLKEGTGPIPQPRDTVSVNYRGTLINGKEFDSSAKRGGQPAKFVVGGIIKGWSEALQMMKVGSKWEIYMPASLAYGDRGAPGTIEPGSVLIFEVELVATESPEPPKPVTSDIIRVPSADEMKAGAKVEVIKSEDVDKKAPAAQNVQVKPGN